MDYNSQPQPLPHYSPPFPNWTIYVIGSAIVAGCSSCCRKYFCKRRNSDQDLDVVYTIDPTTNPEASPTSLNINPNCAYSSVDANLTSPVNPLNPIEPDPEPSPAPVKEASITCYLNMDPTCPVNQESVPNVDLTTCPENRNSVNTQNPAIIRETTPTQIY